jgi:arylsulfatase A-like enzyme
VLRIPLVLISFGYRPQALASVRAFPTQVDIAPTILADLAIPQPATWSGRPVQDPNGPAFSFFEEQNYAGLMDHRDSANVWKYWVDRKTGQDHVFNLSVDPREQRDLSAALPVALVRDWRARVLAHTSVAVAAR